MISSLLGTIIDVGAVALVIIFQPEVRHFLFRIGGRNNISRLQFIGKLFGARERRIGSEAVSEIVEACVQMSSDKTGALIVIPHTNPLQYIIETGDRIDAIVNRRLIISGERIIAARCTLPITGRSDIPPALGMRHKAAIGITEEADCDVIVVSEETGGVSFVHGGSLRRVGNRNELKLLLTSSLEGEKIDFNG